MSHTPGPWRIVGFSGEHDEGGAMICAGDKPIAHTTGLVGETKETWDRYQADAGLIAAAPELLDALKKAVDLIRRWHNLSFYGDGPLAQSAWKIYIENAPEMKPIVAAISKAEGRS